MPKIHLIALVILILSSYAHGKSISEALSGMILSDPNGNNCALYFQADKNHAGYSVHAVIPPSALKENANYDCINGRFRACNSQQLTYVHCYDGGYCNEDWTEYITFNSDYTGFKFAPTGADLEYSIDTAPFWCPENKIEE